MTLAPLRCPGPHPVFRGKECGHWLANVLPGTVEVRRTSEAQPGCVLLTCPRCGAEYRVCPAERVA